MQDVTILAMASLSQTRDTDTGHHLRRTQHYVRLLAHHMKTKPGYPDGLTGMGIPIPARLMSISDVYDALSCNRVYKLAMPEDRVIAIALALEDLGSFSAPELVDAFLELSHEFLPVALRYADKEIERAEKAKFSASTFGLTVT